MQAVAQSQGEHVGQKAGPQLTDPLIPALPGARLMGVSVATFYRLVAAGKLPKPIRIGPRCSRWRESDIKGYIEKCSAGESA